MAISRLLYINGLTPRFFLVTNVDSIKTAVVPN